jgi:hypothetical protein
VRVFFLILLEVVLFLVFVGFGEFPGFVIWVVLSVMVYFANRHFALRAADVVIKAAAEDRKRDERLRKQLSDAASVREQLQAAQPAKPRALKPAPTKHAKPRTTDATTSPKKKTTERRAHDDVTERRAPAALMTPTVADPADTERAARRFTHCPHCDAKNNATREWCWQCKLSLREAVADEDAPESAGPTSAVVDENDVEDVESKPRFGMPSCRYCGAWLHDDDVERCGNCGRTLPKVEDE